MECFYLTSKDKNPEAVAAGKASKSASGRSNLSISTDCDHKRTGSGFNSQNISDFSSESTSTTKNYSFAALSQRQSNNLRVFTFTELKTATKNFSRSLMIGEGGFGSVYRGVIRNGEQKRDKIDIAVKQLSRRGLQGHKEWVTEVNVLGVVDNPNLVKLVGYCAEDDERGIQRLLVYEFMPNKSVQDHLSSRFETPLPWSARLKIAQDAARGLAYLHEGMDFQIIFRDFKSSNILLDEQWNAKLSDFGLARLGPSDGLSHVSTAVVGTIGYAAPEYIQTGRLTSKSDVWGYGIFLYELITGRRPLDRNRPKDEQKLVDWVRPHLSDIRKFKLILDPRLQGKYDLKSAQKLAAVANQCLVRQGKGRPKMSQVLVMVDKIVDATDLGSPLLPMKSLAPKANSETSRRARLKRKLLSPMIGEKVLSAWKRWRRKAIRASG
ncbi:Protein kinase superfamily protein [Euphorbia peplus]|nr:Protein kinase superfamily protein [Euphorbia peplus]